MQLQATSSQEEVTEEVKDEVKAEEEPEPQLMQVDPTKAAPKTPSEEDESDQNWDTINHAEKWSNKGDAAWGFNMPERYRMGLVGLGIRLMEHSMSMGI